MQILIFLLALGHTASASPSTEIIPAPVLRAQELMVAQGTCQDFWQEYLAEPGRVAPIELNRDYKMWVLPCAVWAFNPASSVYITISESTHPDGFITKPVSFLEYRSEGKLISGGVIHNVQWNQATKTLRSEFNPDGRGFCGMRAQYVWDLSYQTFAIVWMSKQDDCKDPSKPWETIIGHDEVN